jgi:hypothetical protein
MLKQKGIVWEKTSVLIPALPLRAARAAATEFRLAVKYVLGKELPGKVLFAASKNTSSSSSLNKV